MWQLLTLFNRNTWCNSLVLNHFNFPIFDPLMSLVSFWSYLSSCPTFEKAGVVHRSWVDILVPHLIFVPAIIAHIFLPLFEPATVHQVPGAKRNKKRFCQQSIVLNVQLLETNWTDKTIQVWQMCRHRVELKLLQAQPAGLEILTDAFFFICILTPPK